MLDADPASPTADSFVTLVESDTFLIEGRLFGDAWATPTDETKEKALKWATYLLTTMWDWNLDKLVASQPLPFPTTADEGFPLVLRRSCAEVALLLLEKDPTVPLPILQKGFKEAKADVLGVTLDRRFVPVIFPTSVVTALEPYGKLLNDAGSSTRIVPLERS